MTPKQVAHQVGDDLDDEYVPDVGEIDFTIIDKARQDMYVEGIFLDDFDPEYSDDVVKFDDFEDLGEGLEPRLTPEGSW